MISPTIMFQSVVARSLSCTEIQIIIFAHAIVLEINSSSLLLRRLQDGHGRGDVHAVRQVGQADVDLAVAHAVVGHAEDVHGTAVLADVGADEGVAEGDDVSDASDIAGGGAGDGVADDHGSLAVTGHGNVGIGAGSGLVGEDLAGVDVTGETQTVVVVEAVVVVHTDGGPEARVETVGEGWTDRDAEVGWLEGTLDEDEDVGRAGCALLEATLLDGNRGGKGLATLWSWSGLGAFGHGDSRHAWWVGLGWSIASVSFAVCGDLVASSRSRP